MSDIYSDIEKAILEQVSVKDDEWSSKIDFNERLKLVRDYSKIPKNRSFSNPLSLYINGCVNEGLIHTYPIDKVIEYTKKYFGFADNQIQKCKSENNLEKIIIEIPNIRDNVKIIEKAMDTFGYFLSSPTETELQSIPNQWVGLNFEPKFQEDDTEDIKSKYPKLYHVTPKYNWGKIKSVGLSPRNKNNIFNFPNRIYFIYPNFVNEDDLYDLIYDMGQILSDTNKSVGNTGEYCVLEIDISDIGENVHLYYDPNFEYGCYSQDYIKPQYIKKIMDFDFDLN